MIHDNAVTGAQAPGHNNFTNIVAGPAIQQMAFMQLLTLGIATLMLAMALPLSAAGLADGYQSMYDLDFSAAHQKFASWKKANPDDPMGPVSNAAAYLFSELERLRVLDSELFVDDGKFKSREHLTASADTKRAFEQELRNTREASQRVLGRAPNDQNALLADVLAHGLEADYLSLIEHRDLAALGVVKEGRALAIQLLNTHPDCYDAYLAIGVENYLLSLKPAPVRWILSWGGAQTSKEEGIAKLRLTAEKGYLLQPYARMLLAVAALRDNDRTHAAELLEGLARDFPHNRLYAAELARVKGAK
jgi:hypothetical protein